MLPTFGTWECYQGDGFARQFEFTVDDVVQDLTDWAIRFTAKSSPTDEDSEAVIDVAATLDDGAESMTLTLTENDTDVAVGTYYADIEIRPDTGSPVTITGRFRVGQDVRRGS